MNLPMKKPELWSDSRILNIGSGFRHKMLSGAFLVFVLFRVPGALFFVDDFFTGQDGLGDGRDGHEELVF